jgi:hypothetical protein
MCFKSWHCGQWPLFSKWSLSCSDNILKLLYSKYGTPWGLGGGRGLWLLVFVYCIPRSLIFYLWIESFLSYLFYVLNSTCVSIGSSVALLSEALMSLRIIVLLDFLVLCDFHIWGLLFHFFSRL